MNHLLTINIGDYITPKVADSFTAAAQRWGCNFATIEHAFGLCGPMDIFGMKLEWWRLPFDDDDLVLLMDGDMLIREDCPSPFHIAQREYNDDWVVAGVRAFQGDDPGGMVDYLSQDFGIACGRLGLYTFLDPEIYINGGLLLFHTGRARPVWRKFVDLVARCPEMHPLDGFIEQHGMNAILKSSKSNILLLPDEFNRLGPAAWHDGPEMRSYVEHYADIGGRRPHPKDYYLGVREWARVPTEAVSVV